MRYSKGKTQKGPRRKQNTKFSTQEFLGITPILTSLSNMLKSHQRMFSLKLRHLIALQKPAPLHIIPQLWFRNQWAWWDVPLPEPKISNLSKEQKCLCLFADDSNLPSPPNVPFEYRIGPRYLYASEGGVPLFTNNENPAEGKSYFKDGLHGALIQKAKTINPQEVGTKAALHYFYEAVPPKSSVKIYLRLSPAPCEKPLDEIEKTLAKRKQEADAFYDSIHPKNAPQETRYDSKASFSRHDLGKTVLLF